MTKIYLISPPKIDLATFSFDLQRALKTGLVPVFQLRLKNYLEGEIVKLAKEIKKICHDNNCLFIVNDSLEVAIKSGADGLHVGDEDGKVKEIRKNVPKDFIVGASCYDSRHLAINAAEDGANYVSFGAFFETKTKESKGKPTIDLVNWALEILNIPIVAIGGINNQNCKILADNKIDFISVISYVWQHPNGADFAIKSLHQNCTI